MHRLYAEYCSRGEDKRLSEYSTEEKAGTAWGDWEGSSGVTIGLYPEERLSLPETKGEQDAPG